MKGVGKYLVIYESSSGMAQIHNVLVVDALSAEEAKLHAHTMLNSSSATLRVFDLNDIRIPWMYYH